MPKPIKYPTKRERVKALGKQLAKKFDLTVNDSAYISKDKNLLEQHIEIINNAEYTRYVQTPLRKCDFYARDFKIFKFGYPTIYYRWRYLLTKCYRACYDIYKFFGAKGIHMDDDFLDGKKFCIWCLKHGLTNYHFSYEKYLQRKDKSKNYSADNCFVVSERDLRAGKDLKQFLTCICLAKRYDESDKKELFADAYARFYLYDMSADDALLDISYFSNYVNCNIKNRGPKIGFSPYLYYNSVAIEGDVPYSTFLSRIIATRNIEHRISIRPFDMLKPEYSEYEITSATGITPYKQQWDKEHRRGKSKNKMQNQQNDTQ